jgi:hypothetical protein
VETTALTRSFGWDSSEVWQQHDVQELCRVMFDALEHTWRGTDQANLINQLYQGKLKDYVKCLEVTYLLFVVKWVKLLLRNLFLVFDCILQVRFKCIIIITFFLIQFLSLYLSFTAVEQSQ